MCLTLMAALLATVTPALGGEDPVTLLYDLADATGDQALADAVTYADQAALDRAARMVRNMADPGDLKSDADARQRIIDILRADVVYGDPTTAGPPANDLCDDRIPIGDGTTAFDTTGAGTDGLEPDDPCNDFPGSPTGGNVFNDIWYNYVATCDGTLTVTTCEDLGGSAAYDTDLAVYDCAGVDCSGLACPPGDADLLGCDDDDDDNPCGGSPDFHSTVMVPVVNGNAYKIRVGGFSSGDSGSGVLLVECAPGVCGNGILDGGEECDDGNTINGDGCADDCTNELGVCGDGILNAGQGEECDDGNTNNLDGCDNNCNAGLTCDSSLDFSCGDAGIVPVTAAGTTVGDFATNCWSSASDGTGWASFVATATSARVQTCNSVAPADDSQIAVYSSSCAGLTQIGCSEDDCGGSGFLGRVALEGLTIGNTYYVEVGAWGSGDVGDYLLEIDCPFPSVCPNGEVEPGEECDDGNTTAGDGCDPACQLECGNGVLDPGEECDDGNNDDGDGCSATCVEEFCGDGILQAGLGEECDDGNTISGDGCDATCLFEFGACCFFAPSDCQSLSAEDCDSQGGLFVGGDCLDANCEGIPTVSEWGVIVMTILLLTGGTIVFRASRRRANLRA